MKLVSTTTSQELTRLQRKHLTSQKSHQNRITATGKTNRENNENKAILNSDIIRHLDNPYDKQGGLSILYGNLAPNGAVIKVGGVDPSIKVFKGKAICFDSHDEAVE